MIGRSRGARRRERGMSLAEVTVASALALVGFLVALILYEAARDLFKKGEQAVDQQQQVRLGFDQMVRDLRLGGYNFNPDGAKLRVDEQIEGAWDGAVFVRADYDKEDTTGRATDPEEFIKGVMNVVSTGNDEIVGYVLRKPDASGGGAITINADVNSSTTATSPIYGTVATRDNVVEAVSVSNVWSGLPATQTNPPYTLYRVSFSNASANFGSSSFVELSPIAENVQSLRFRYYDGFGSLITSLPGGADTSAAIEARAEIARIEVELIGMTELPDRDYIDPNDSNPATRNHRKFSLAADVTPRNLGYVGVPDIDLTAPSVPTGLATCAGHCEGMIVSWNANPPSDLVTSYTVRYGTSPTVLSTSRTTFNTWLWLPNLTAVTHYFQVRAEDASGNSSFWSSTVSGLVRDDVSPTLTTPVAVDDATATASGNGGSGMLENQIDLNWTAVTQNVENISCDPAGPNVLRDLKGYRIHRSTSPSGGPTGSPYVDEASLTDNFFTDASVVNCRDYYYYIATVDKCSHVSAAWSSSMHGKASTSDQPAKPIGVTAVRTGMTSVDINWSAVTQDTGGDAILIDTYEVYRSLVPADGPDPNSSVYTLIGTAVGGTAFTDTSAPPTTSPDTPYYKIRAKDDCPNYSDYSNPAAPPACTLSGTVTISPPDGSTLGTGGTSITVDYSGPESITSGELVITKAGGSEDFNQTQTGPPPYVFNWVPGQGLGTYTAVATVSDGPGCTGTAQADYEVVSAPPCCLTVDINDTLLTPFSGNNKDGLIFEVLNDGTCGDDVRITQLVVKMQVDGTTVCSPQVTRLRRIRSPLGTTVWSTGNPGDPLPATAPITPVRVDDGDTALFEVLFTPTDAIGCSVGSSKYRDTIATDIEFDTVGPPVISGGLCANVQLTTGVAPP